MLNLIGSFLLLLIGILELLCAIYFATLVIVNRHDECYSLGAKISDSLIAISFLSAGLVFISLPFILS